MLYLKTHITDEIEIKVPIYDDEIFSYCLDCSKEMQIETEELVQILRDGSLCGTSIRCADCTKNKACGHPLTESCECYQSCDSATFKPNGFSDIDSVKWLGAQIQYNKDLEGCDM